MPKFKTGDLFSIKLTGKEYGSGRIMLDVKRQCIRPKLLKAGSPLTFFGNALLIEVYRETSPEPDAKQSEVLIPGIFVDPASLDAGAWTVAGHEDVDPTTVEFPETLIGVGTDVHFRRGEISLPINLTHEDLDRIDAGGTIHPSGILGEICLYHLGRTEDIDNPNLKDAELRSLKHSDIRFSDRRSEIYKLLGEDENQTYYEMSTRLGFDIRRFYAKTDRKRQGDDADADGAGMVILCPYCRSPIREDTKTCPRCGQDTTRDAPIEMTPEEYRDAERMVCPNCGSLILKSANPCPACGEPQRRTE